ncbi:MAG: PIN domain-containing protein [Opitutaceae bacterium]|jgi:predicted nucleic acid-binding protein
MDLPILVDSNIYIGLLRRGYDPVSVLFEHYDSANLVTCGLVRLEVLRGVRVQKTRERVSSFMDVMQYVEADTLLWAEATALAARTDRNGTPISATDAFIAACAFRRSASVLTEDKDFKLITDLPLLSLPPGIW